jgi:hypothetical protein
VVVLDTTRLEVLELLWKLTVLRQLLIDLSESMFVARDELGPIVEAFVHEYKETISDAHSFTRILLEIC